MKSKITAKPKNFEQFFVRTFQQIGGFEKYE